VDLRRGSFAPCTSSLFISLTARSRFCRAATRASDIVLIRSEEAVGANQVRCEDQLAIAFLAALL
jgi:hypothetical protein